MVHFLVILKCAGHMATRFSVYKAHSKARLVQAIACRIINFFRDKIPSSKLCFTLVLFKAWYFQQARFCCGA